MMTRPPLASHRVFAPLIALWFAALLGLTVAVLPAAVLERALAAVGIDGLRPLTIAARATVGIAATAIGALIGYAVAQWIARRVAGDPRPIYAEAEPEAEPPAETQRRRPLHVREELAGGFGDESQVAPAGPQLFDPQPQGEDGFMILTPQPIHPPQPEPDLELLLEQFDNAMDDAVRADDGERIEGAAPPPGDDPVKTFVARQTGARVAAPASPIGGPVPDHQAELRAALDKLARSQGQI